MSIIGISGLAGSGKGETAKVLVERFGFVKIALADEMKRFCARTFGWDHSRLWGPSEKRNEPDPEWNGLTARRALQQLGTEWGRTMHEDVWVRIALRNAQAVLNGAGYSPEIGANDFNGGFGDAQGVVIDDVRFSNEVAAIHAVGGKVWRIVRPSAGLAGSAGAHASEIEIASLEVDGTISNTSTLENLERDVRFFARVVGLTEVPQ